IERATVGFRPQLFAETVEKILASSHRHARYPIPTGVAWAIRLRRFAPDWLWDRLVRRRMNW
ncbi:MAG: hypothetical protein AAB658_06235, partial [Chloroflexota bacterium]